MKFITHPWVGEFGWELFGWQAFMRALNEQFQPEEFVCVTRPGREVLYEDFATVETIDFNSIGDGFRSRKCDITQEQADRVYSKYAGYNQISISWYNYEGKPVATAIDGKMQQISPLFHAYGTTNPIEDYDLIFHMRDRKHFRTDDNWSEGNWEKVYEWATNEGLRVAFIGSKDEAKTLDAEDDLRGIPLELLVRYLAGAKAIVGPSSGPMHLATLCKCPQLVWSGAEKNRIRYEKQWNPFGTPVKYLGEEEGGWNPHPNVVIEALERNYEFNEV